MFLTQIMQSLPHVFANLDAIALFGSAIRGDPDQFSDKDVLLVSDDKDSLAHAKTILKRLGFSASCYDWNKLRVMSARKALFLQHLKQESLIILDRTNGLEDILASFEPAENYSKELELTRSLITLTERFPDTPIGVGWALDILAVGFRNLAILSCANEGRYVFSYQRLLKSLVDFGVIDEHEHSPLWNLREYKAKYRNRNFVVFPSKDVVYSIQRILCHAFNIEMCPKNICETAFQHYCLFSEKALEVTNWYLQTRLCEGAFMTWYTSNRQCISQSLGRLRKIEQVITNPSCYAFLFSFPCGDLRSDVLNVMALTLRQAA